MVCRWAVSRQILHRKFSLDVLVAWFVRSFDGSNVFRRLVGEILAQAHAHRTLCHCASPPATISFLNGVEKKWFLLLLVGHISFIFLFFSQTNANADLQCIDIYSYVVVARLVPSRFNQRCYRKYCDKHTNKINNFSFSEFNFWRKHVHKIALIAHTYTPAHPH